MASERKLTHLSVRCSLKSNGESHTPDTPIHELSYDVWEKTSMSLLRPSLNCWGDWTISQEDSFHVQQHLRSSL